MLCTEITLDIKQSRPLTRVTTKDWPTLIKVWYGLIWLFFMFRPFLSAVNYNLAGNYIWKISFIEAKKTCLKKQAVFHVSESCS